jgi:hypothetical protein
MLLRVLFVSLALMIAAPLAWRAMQSDSVKNWWNPPPPPKPFQFDNGTVRQAPQPSGPLQTVSPGLKKCRQGDKLVYTDGPCPAGSKPETISGNVNVVSMPKPAPAQAAAAPGKPASGALARLPNVRDALHDPGPTIREKAMERAIDNIR